MVNVNDDAYYDNLIKMINKDEFDYLQNNIKSIIRKYRTIVNKCEDYNTLVYKLKDLYNQYSPNLFEVLGKQLFNGTILDLRTDNIKIPQHAYEFIKRYLFLINYQRNTLSNFEFIFNHQTEPLIWIINQDQVSYYPITNKLFMALRDFMFFYRTMSRLHLFSK